MKVYLLRRWAEDGEIDEIVNVYDYVVALEQTTWHDHQYDDRAVNVLREDHHYPVVWAATLQSGESGFLWLESHDVIHRSTT